MTDEKALEIMKKQHFAVLTRNPILQATGRAILALEKQIAKKPNLWGDGYADGVLVYDMYECPNCSKNYEVDYEKYDYCPNCGQKLDWSDLK